MMRSVLAAEVLCAGLVLAACSAAGSGGGGGFTDAASGGTGAIAGSGATGGAGGTSATGGSGGTSATGGTGGTGGSTGGTGGSTGGTGGTDAGTGGTGGIEGGLTTTVSGTIVGLIGQSPIAGLKVCVYKAPSIPCVMTDSSGHYTLPGVPVGQEVLLEYTKTSYFPVLVTVLTTSSALDAGQFLMPTTAQADAFAVAVGTTIDPQKGQVLFTAFTPSTGGGYTGQDGVSATISPKSGTGPYYTASNLPNTSLTATSTDGVGLFANVSAGNYDVNLTHSTKSCQRFSTSWVGSGSTASKITVVAGYLTGGAALLCP